MSNTFNLADAMKRPVVQLDENRYFVKSMTRETMVALMELSKQTAPEAKADTPEDLDKMAFAIIDQVDAMLDPDGDETPRAGSFLRDKWVTNEVPIEALSALATFIGDKGEESPPA